MELEEIKYQGNFFNFILLSLFSLLFVGFSIFFFMASDLVTRSITDFEMKLMFILSVVMVISLFTADMIGTLSVVGYSKRFIIMKGYWPLKKNRIEIKINDVLEWKGTKMPWYILFKENKEGKMDYKSEVESRSYNAVEIWLRDRRTVAFRCKRPLNFFDYLKEMKSQDH